MTAPENPAAFPCTADWVHLGMTLRDWFAGQCLAGTMAHHDGRVWEAAAKKLGIGPDQAFARGMYAMADAMLAERERQP